MLHFPENQSDDDTQAWLREGWFATSDSMSPLRFYDTDMGTVMAIDHQSGSRQRVIIDHKAIMVHWPRCGAINLADHAVYVERHAERQWTQTYRSNQVRVKVPGAWHVMRALGVSGLNTCDPDTYGVVKELFDPYYPSLPKARDMLRYGVTASVAINPHLTLVLRGEDILVYHRTRLVAEIIGDRMREIGGHSKVARLTKHFGGMLA